MRYQHDKRNKKPVKNECLSVFICMSVRVRLVHTDIDIETAPKSANQNANENESKRATECPIFEYF